jgi:hypothetical protein
MCGTHTLEKAENMPGNRKGNLSLLIQVVVVEVGIVTLVGDPIQYVAVQHHITIAYQFNLPFFIQL